MRLINSAMLCSFAISRSQRLQMKTGIMEAVSPCDGALFSLSIYTSMACRLGYSLTRLFPKTDFHDKDSTFKPSDKRKTAVKYH